MDSILPKTTKINKSDRWEFPGGCLEVDYKDNVVDSARIERVADSGTYTLFLSSHNVISVVNTHEYLTGLHKALNSFMQEG